MVMVWFASMNWSSAVTSAMDWLNVAWPVRCSGVMALPCCPMW